MPLASDAQRRYFFANKSAPSGSTEWTDGYEDGPLAASRQAEKEQEVRGMMTAHQAEVANSIDWSAFGGGEQDGPGAAGRQAEKEQEVRGMTAHQSQVADSIDWSAFRQDGGK